MFEQPTRRFRGTNSDKEVDGTTSPKYQLGKAAWDKQSHQTLLDGDVIRRELSDTNLNRYSKVDEIVTAVTEETKNAIKTSVILFVGFTGQGRSELLTKLLDKIPCRRGAEQKPKISSPGCGSVTKVVETFSRTVDSWTTEGVEKLTQ